MTEHFGNSIDNLYQPGDTLIVVRRTVSSKVLEYSRHYPVVTVTGPRQSGKTTLCKMLFPDRPYVSLEDLEERRFASDDPKGFLDRFPSGAVIDEVQRVPDLLSSVQIVSDAKNKPGFFILTGSQNLLLMERVSQSLAGRTALVTLHPFTLREAYQGRVPGLDEVLYTGFFPRIFDQGLNPSEASSFYVSTYVERDIRRLVNVRDLSQFEIFLRLCAGRTGQLLNLSSLGADVGVSHNTARQWLSILETSYIVKLLKPSYKSLGSRMVKSPKLYFLDTGLAAYLLSITDRDHLQSHPLRGPLFESFVISELLKLRANQGRADNLFFFRDNKGAEIDVVLDQGQEIELCEAKSAKTVDPDVLLTLRSVAGRHGRVRSMYLVYGGEESRTQQGCRVTSWRDMDALRP